MPSCPCNTFDDEKKRNGTNKRPLLNDSSSKTWKSLTEEPTEISKEVEERRFRFESDNLETNPLRFWEMRDLDASRIERNIPVNKVDEELYVKGEETAAMLKTRLLELHKLLLDQIEQAKLLANNSAAYMDSFMDTLLSAYHDQRTARHAKKKLNTGSPLCSKGGKRRRTF